MKKLDCNVENLSQIESDLRNEISWALIDEFFLYTVDSEIPDIVMIDVYDISNERRNQLQKELTEICGKYSGLLERDYIPHVVNRFQTLKHYPQYVLRNCNVCGASITKEEIIEDLDAECCSKCRKELAHQQEIE